LTKIEGISTPEAQKQADSVKKAYIEDISYLKTLKKEVTEVEKPPLKEGIERITFGDVLIQLPRDVKSIERAKKKS